MSDEPVSQDGGGKDPAATPPAEEAPSTSATPEPAPEPKPAPPKEPEPELTTSSTVAQFTASELGQLRPSDVVSVKPSDAGRVTPGTKPAGARQRFSTGRFDTQKLTINSALRTPFLKNLLRLPLKKIAIWGAFAGVLFALRDFFGLIFLTFVLAYITGSIVDRVSIYFSSRRVPIILVFIGFLGVMVGLGFATVPRAVRAGEQQLRTLRDMKDPGRFFEVRLGKAVGTRPEVELMAAHQGGVLGAVFGSPERRQEEAGLLATLAPYLSDPSISGLLRENLTAIGQGLRDSLAAVLKAVWTGILYLFLALIFSFMIVWDRDRLSAGMDQMDASRLGDVWHEVVPSIATFGRLLGKAFEAQTLIAIVNMALTCFGMLLMGIPGIPALALVVFICSFVPIVGVYASTVPIFMVAIQKGGILLGLGVIVMVSVVHVIEAYVLNPRIYGHHMKLHPLAVLIVLTLGGHLIGLWGLILGVPLATYVWRHLVMGEAEHIYVPEETPLPQVPETVAASS